MHTELRLHDGVLMTSIVTKEEVEISKVRWRAAITPGVQLLQLREGGTMFVPHDLEDLTD